MDRRSFLGFMGLAPAAAIAKPEEKIVVPVKQKVILPGVAEAIYQQMKSKKRGGVHILPMKDIET